MISPSSKAEEMVFLMVSIWSEMVKICITFIPIFFSSAAIKLELVSTVLPERISSPMVIRTAFSYNKVEKIFYTNDGIFPVTGNIN
jgi:hypothetical protein